jgi:hypothetical protein
MFTERSTCAGGSSMNPSHVPCRGTSGIASMFASSQIAEGKDQIARHALCLTGVVRVVELAV